MNDNNGNNFEKHLVWALFAFGVGILFLTIVAG